MFIMGILIAGKSSLNSNRPCLPTKCSNHSVCIWGGQRSSTAFKQANFVFARHGAIKISFASRLTGQRKPSLGLWLLFNTFWRSILINLILSDMLLITRLMGPTWGPSGADMTQVSPMLSPWTLLSGRVIGLSKICILFWYWHVWWVSMYSTIIHPFLFVECL